MADEIRPKSGPTAPLDRRRSLVLDVHSAVLVVEQGADRGSRAAVGGAALKIGQGPDCDFVLTDPAVSRAHAVIAPIPGGFVIDDLGSTNGTEIDGVEVRSAPLRDGCRIRLGGTVLRFTATRTKIPCPSASGTDLAGLSGESRVMRDVMGFLAQVAPTDATLILTGETGVGKEVAARAVHALSARATGPFVIVDCANVQPDLLGSELFGHARGAFTGAVDPHKGAFERAHRGTLLLDEVGELPPDVQARLLGVLQRREIQPLGSESARPVDVRVLAATHRDLASMVSAGRFREDLYYRLAVFSVELPPLRDRREDIPQLARRILAELVPRGRVPDLVPEAVELLKAAPWKGNVRELRNALHRALVLAGAGDIEPHHLAGGPGRPPEPPAAAAGGTLDATERRLIQEALVRHGGNRIRAAQELGISLSTLKRRLREQRED